MMERVGSWLLLAFIGYIGLYALVNVVQPSIAKAALSSSTTLDRMLLTLLAFMLTPLGLVLTVLVGGGIFVYAKFRGA